MRRLAVAVLAVWLAGCSSAPVKPKPAELVPLPAASAVQPKLLWSLKLAPHERALQAQVSGDRLTLAGGDGTVLQIDPATGRELWRHAVGSPLAAGVGSDGQRAAVVTQANELVVLEGGQPLWRQRLPAQTYTAPLVAGGRVFVLGADRSVSAFDGRTGARLWIQQRAGGDPLVLRQSGVLLSVGDTLVVGLSGRLVGLNPLNGSARWEAPVAVPRGLNEIERLVDLVGPAARQANGVCVRAFQAAVGCVDAESGSTAWSQRADGVVGLAGDASLVFGAEANGDVRAWRRSSGERVWTQEQLRFRELSAPAVAGPAVVLGDFQGQVHLLARQDGRLLGRVPTDGSAIVAAPVLAGRTLVVLTQAGGVFALEAP